MFTKKIDKTKDALIEELITWNNSILIESDERWESLLKDWPELIKSQVIIWDEDDGVTSMEYEFDYEKIKNLSEGSIISFFKDYVEVFHDWYFFTIREDEDSYILIGAHTYENSQYVKECNKYKD